MTYQMSNNLTDANVFCSLNLVFFKSLLDQTSHPQCKSLAAGKYISRAQDCLIAKLFRMHSHGFAVPSQPSLGCQGHVPGSVFSSFNCSRQCFPHLSQSRSSLSREPQQRVSPIVFLYLPFFNSYYFWFYLNYFKMYFR